jgi:hypothetical protein
MQNSYNIHLIKKLAIIKNYKISNIGCLNLKSIIYNKVFTTSLKRFYVDRFEFYHSPMFKDSVNFINLNHLKNGDSKIVIYNINNKLDLLEEWYIYGNE